MKATDFISPEIKAQEESKRAILEVTDYILPVYESSIKKGNISDFTVKMEVWNRGYQVTITPIAKDMNLSSDACRVYIQPSTFFDSEYLRGEASFEFGIFFSLWNSYSGSQKVKGEIKVDTNFIKSQIDDMML